MTGAVPDERPFDAIALSGHFQVALHMSRQLRPAIGDRIRLETLLLSLAERGITSQDDRVPLWAAAAICRTRSERDLFLEAFVPAALDPVADQAAFPPSTSRPIVDKWFRRRLTVLGGLAFLGLAVIALVWWLYVPTPEPTEPTCSVPGPCSIQGMQEVFGDVVVPGMHMVYLLDWRLAVWLMPVVVGLLYYAWLRRHRAIARRRPDPEPRLTGLVEPLLGETMLFARSRAAFRRLLRHEEAPGRTLDVRGTVNATVRAGGLPTFLFGNRRRTPEYLFLSERASASDHLQMVAKLLRRRMTTEQVAVRHFEFAGRPVTLHRVDQARQGPPEHLATVLAAHPNARVILMIEAFDIGFEDEVPAWLVALADNREAFHFNPRRPEHWDETERIIERTGIQSWYIGGDGLSQLGKDRPTRKSLRTASALSAPRPDLTADYAKRRRALLGAQAPRDLSLAPMLSDLRRAFDADEIQWLAALALYPAIVPRLTVALGEHVHDRSGVPLLTEARLIEIARLPWLRAGRMPDWLRGPLARLATRETLRRAVPVIQALLLEKEADRSDEAHIEVGDGEDENDRAELIEWLNACPESELHDRLLIDALRGKPPRLLGRDRVDMLPRPMRTLLRNRRMVEVMLVAVVIVALLILVPPGREVAQPTGETTVAKVSTFEPSESERDGETNGPKGDVGTADNDGATANSVDTAPNGSEAVSAQPTPDSSPSSPDVPQAASRPIITGQSPPADFVAAGRFIVFFEWDKSDVSPEGSAIIDNAVQTLDKFEGDAVVQIQCWSDNLSGPSDAMSKSSQRCTSVVKEVRSFGVSSQRISTVAHGSGDPTKDMAVGVRDPENRRAEIILFRPGPRNNPNIARRPYLDPTGTEDVPADVVDTDAKSDKLYDLKNYAGAANLNSSSCKRGSYRGCYWNGYLYEAGRGVIRDLEAALQWYTRACDLGLRQGCAAQQRLQAGQEPTVPPPPPPD